MSPDRRRLAQRDHEREDRVREYVLSQSSPKERVKHVELVAHRNMLGRRYDIWDVHTRRRGRWWVIDPPMHLYDQRRFPRMDETFTFHLGLMHRVLANEQPEGSDREQERLSAAWRKYEDAVTALVAGDDPEDFQAVGLRLRESMLAMVRALGAPSMVPAGAEAPKRGDVVGWTDVIANAVATGDRSERVRGHMKATAETTWQLVSWLTHAQGATLADGLIARWAVRHVLSIYGMGVIRHEVGLPDRCPECGSYRVSAEGPDDNITFSCDSCGWETPKAGEGGT